MAIQRVLTFQIPFVLFEKENPKLVFEIDVKGRNFTGK